MVDDDGGRQGSQEIPAFGEVRGLEVDHDVPAEAGDPLDDAVVVAVGLGIGQAADELEPNAAHPGLVQCGEFVVGDIGAHRRHAAGAAGQERSASASALLSAP